MAPGATYDWGTTARYAAMDLTSFVQLLHDAHLERERQLADQFQRSLPFADGMFDRWERARRLGFGARCSIYDSALVFGTVSVGDDTWVGPNVILDGSGGPLEIGSFCAVSAGVHVYTHDTVLWALSGGKQERRTAGVRIGDRCHLGAQSIVRAGTRIGDRCVVGANSFVNRDIPDHTVVAGSPAREIGRVEVEPDGTVRVVPR